MRSPLLFASLAAVLLAGCGDLRYLGGIPAPVVTVSGPMPVELPYREAKGGLVLVTGRVNGAQDVDFILDTGAPVTVLVDGPRTAPLRLDLTGARRLGPEDDPAVPFGVIRPGFSIAFGPVGLEELHAVLVSGASLPCPERMEAVGFGGVVGADLFRRFVVEVDPSSRRVRLHEPSAWQPPAGARAIALAFESGHPFVDAMVERGGGSPPLPARLHVDSGMNKALSLNTGPGTGLAMPAEGKPSSGCFVSGRSVGRDGAPLSLSLGGHRVDDVVPTYEAPGGPAVRRAGAIGSALLFRGRVFIDYPAKRLFLPGA